MLTRLQNDSPNPTDLLRLSAESDSNYSLLSHRVGIGGANLIKPELGYFPSSRHSQDVLLSRSTLSPFSLAICTSLAQGHYVWMLLALLQHCLPWLLLCLVCRSETRTHPTTSHQPQGHIANTALAMHAPSLMPGMLLL